MFGFWITLCLVGFNSALLLLFNFYLLLLAANLGDFLIGGLVVGGFRLVWDLLLCGLSFAVRTEMITG